MYKLNLKIKLVTYNASLITIQEYSAGDSL